VNVEMFHNWSDSTLPEILLPCSRIHPWMSPQIWRRDFSEQSSHCPGWWTSCPSARLLCCFCGPSRSFSRINRFASVRWVLTSVVTLELFPKNYHRNPYGQ
jgi:hypothetical protein